MKDIYKLNKKVYILLRYLSKCLIKTNIKKITHIQRMRVYNVLREKSMSRLWERILCP